MNWNRLQKQALRQHLQRARRRRAPEIVAEGVRSHGITRSAKRRIRFQMAYGLVCLAIIFAVAKAVVQLDLRSPIAKRYEAFDQAYLARNTKVMKQILAPDFHLDKARGGQETRDEFVKNLIDSFPPNGHYTRVRELDNGDHSSTVLIDVIHPQRVGSPHRYRYRDRWAERDGVWMLIERAGAWSDPHKVSRKP